MEGFSYLCGKTAVEVYLMDEMLEAVKITLSEKRPADVWLDFSLKEVREGPVSYFRVKDFLSGNWLFKYTVDRELGKVVVKAVKCPPGRAYFTVEGESMVFQRSVHQGFLYDLISVPMVEEGGRVRRKRVKEMEDVPPLIRDNFRIVTHQKATGKETPISGMLSTLTPEEETRSPIILFLLERVWPLSHQNPEEAYRQWKVEGKQQMAPPISKAHRRLLNAVRKVQKARLVDVYEFVKAKVDEDNYLKLLHDLAEAGKISYPQVGYVKVGRGVKATSKSHEDQKSHEI
jgi:hypothetical protein